MKTVRQPTILTWFMFVIVFVIPLALPFVRLDDDFLGPDNEPALKGVFAVGSSVPLIIALVIGLFFRHAIWIAFFCVTLRSAWFFLLVYTDYLLAAPKTLIIGLSASLWTEWWTIEILDLKSPIWSQDAAVSIASDILYALEALLLAATCRLREK